MRLAAVADVALTVLEHGSHGGGVGILQQGHVLVGVQTDALDQVTGQHVRGSAVAPGNDHLVFEERSHILARNEAFAGKKVHIGSVDTVDDGDDGVSVAARIGEVVAVHTADGCEGIAGNNGCHMSAASSLDDVHTEAFVSKVALMDGHIQGQIADEVHRLGDGDLLQVGGFRQGRGQAQQQGQGQTEDSVQRDRPPLHSPGDGPQQKLFRHDHGCIHQDAHHGEHHYAHPYEGQVENSPGVHNHTPQSPV